MSYLLRMRRNLHPRVIPCFRNVREHPNLVSFGCARIAFGDLARCASVGLTGRSDQALVLLLLCQGVCKLRV